MTTDSFSWPSGGGFWGDGRSYQRVALRDIVVTMHVGIADWEKQPGNAQRVIINVEMFRYQEKQDNNTLDACINYDPIHEIVTTDWPKRPHTDLLETLAEELVELCFRDDKVAACRVSLQKPDVYSDTAAALVETYRVRPG